MSTLLRKSNNIKDTSKKYVELDTYILKKDIDKFLECIESINILVQNSQSVPADLIEQYFGYFYDKEGEEFITFEEKLLRLSEGTIKYFSKDSEYKFLNQKGALKFRFEDCIRTVLYGYKLNIIGFKSGTVQCHLDLEQKKMMFNYFYDALCRYTEPFDNKDKLLISKYKKIVIAAYITQKLGSLFITKKKFTKKELYDAAKNYISKLK